MFTPKHFLDLGSRRGVDLALHRLKAGGTIRQLARGLYDYQATDPVLGTVAPSADAIARALVVRDAIRLQPSGAYAANHLGLSEQVNAFLQLSAYRRRADWKEMLLWQRSNIR